MTLIPPTAPRGRSHDRQARTLPPRPRPTAGDVMRGLWAVVALVLGALLELVTALVGLPNPRRYVREARRAVADAYRDGVHDIHPADVIDVGDDIER